ncbi:esterase-like activity of phytase family protein [Streptomyces sp. NPDC050423]|uniref:esterase-like activity of phytase family protein n=1 Tax=Streptomyces sp. NPDC050423 TaxID=3155402 RepID=UPI003445ECF9
MAAQSGGSDTRGGTAALSDIGAKARLPDEKTVPHKLSFRGTTVGGLSGIDRDPCTGEYVAISGDPSRYLVLERTRVAGAGYKIRLFDATTRGATDVQHVDSLKGQKIVPMRKKLVADLADVGLSRIDNTEGMTWGPSPPNGERTLVLVSDDNFAEDEVTQFVALGIR